VIGLGYQGLADIFISELWFQSYLLDDEVGLIQSNHDHRFSLIYNPSFASEVWTFEALLLHSQAQGDGSIQAYLVNLNLLTAFI